jgi:hypothetical protein
VDYSSLRQCDSQLHDCLQVIAAMPKSQRCIEHFRRAGLIDGIREYPEMVEDHVAVHRDRHSARRSWYGEAVATVDECDAVLLDPDNGIAGGHGAKVSLSSKRADKYAFHEEIQNLNKMGITVICYQHAIRSIPFEELLRRIIDDYPGSFAIRWHKLQSRAYLIWPARDTVQWREWAHSLVSPTSPWHRHCTLVHSNTEADV